MNRNLVQHLACPNCRGEFQLSEFEATDEMILRGTLNCDACDSEYRISDSVADLITQHPHSAAP